MTEQVPVHFIWGVSKRGGAENLRSISLKKQSFIFLKANIDHFISEGVGGLNDDYKSYYFDIKI